MRVRATLLALAVVAVVGCGGSEFPVAPVSGRVTLDGEPLANAHVGFEPMTTRDDNRAGPGSYATTDQDGHFRLESLDGLDGAVIGSHRVSIRAFHAKKGPQGEVVVVQKEVLPDRYHVNSELTMEVPKGGTDTANYELKSK